MAILTLDEYKKKQQEQTPIKYTQGTNKSSILTFDEYKKTNDYQTLKSTYKNNSSANTLESYKRRKKELENQLLNYKREEKNPWWDKNDNIIENVGNVAYKLFGEKKEERYKKDKQYDALEKEYADINKKIDDYLVENKTYDNGIKGYLQKSADVTAGNVRTSVDGINSTILKATGQKPVVYDSYAERVGNKAISQSKGAEKVGLEITGSVARMVPQMLMPTKKASYVMGFANYGGSAYNQAKKEGYDEDKATLYGMTIGGLEMGLQGLLGGLDNIYGSSIAGRATDKIMRKIITNSTLRSYITKVGGEFTEEYLQEFLNPIVRNVILEEENGADFWNASNLTEGVKQLSKNLFNKENLYAGALGGLTSGIMDGPALFVNNQTNSNSSSTKPTVPTVQDVVAQEKNSATVSNANIPRLTSETSSGTSSSKNMWEKSSTLTNSNTPSSTSETKGSDISSTTTNNIAQPNEGVNYNKTINPPIKATDLSYQGTSHSGYKASGRGITVDKMNIEVEKMAKKAPKTLESTPTEVLEQIQKAKNNPEAEITIYRGSPKGEINVGDWVFLSEAQAERYTKGIITGTPIAGYEVGKLTVKAKDVDWTGKNLEFVYFPNTSNLNYNQDTIKQTKGNIPINQELLNKYATVREIFDKESNNFNGEVKVRSNIKEIENIDLEKTNIAELKKLAADIFKKHNSTYEFMNNGNKIVVNKSGINESIEKIFNNRRQRNLLKQHLQVFSDLGDIIEKATLINQTKEQKGRNNITLWNYYYKGLNIDGINYNLVFDVRSMENGENQYRVQRLEKNIKKTGDYDGDVSNNTKILPPYSQPVSDNNIPQINNNVKLPVISNNNTQNTGNNANKIMNPNEISKLTPKDANTTPILPNINVSTGRGESHFAKNIENKVDMLSKESKAEILDSNEVKYYQEVTNKASLEKAFARLKEGGESETLNWFNKDSTKATDVDVAEGWILLKQYQDKIQNATDLATKDTETRNMVQVAKKMREMGTKAGQTVQAYNILNRLTPEGMVYYAQSELSEAFDVMSKNKTKEWIDSNRDKFNITPQETEFIMKIMQEVQQMEDGYEKRVKLAEIQKVMTDKLPPSKGAGIKAWMRVSMLFNPKTQVRNVMGNAVIAPVNAFSDLFASVVDKQIAKKTGVRTTGITKKGVKGYFKGLGKGLYESYNDFRKGINTRNIQGNRFEITEGKSFNENHKGIFKKQRDAISRGLNGVDSILSFMLDAGDRTFYEATFTNSINNQLKLNNTTEVTQTMIDIATSEALSRTWQDNNGYTRFVLNVRKGLNAINIGGYGLGDVLIPFAKTPANLTKAIVDYSPAGMVKAINEGINLKRSLSNGQYNTQMQHQFVQDLGKATAGTMLYVLGIALAKAGITTGESDDDKDVANFMKNTLGISSYSIKIGNKSFTYDWAQPIAAPLAITANIVQKQKDGASLKENIMSSLDTAGNILLEQSFLESLNTVLSNNEGIATGIQEAIFELPSRAVPTVFKQIADLIDPVQRQSFEKDKPLETAINKVKAKVPILSKTLAPSVDTMGREIQKYGGKNNIFNVFLNPANVNTENISKSAQEIYRLYKSTGETNIMPRVAPYYINQDGEKINLNSSQREKYQKVSGEIIEDNINKLLKTTEYKNMSDKEKTEVINGIVNYSYNIAKKEVLNIELSNTYQKAYDYSKIGDISDYYSFKASIDDANKDTKKSTITNYLINSNLNNKQLAFLYGSYYSSEETLNNLLDANIPIKEFIKFNRQEFTTDYYNNGKAVTNSRKMKVIKYVNSLNLSVAQKAILIKMEYSSYTKYDKQIVSYINKMNYSKFEKASLLKSFGFDYYDKYLISYVNNMNITKSEKEELLKEMGFTIRNGRVYS